LDDARFLAEPSPKGLGAASAFRQQRRGLSNGKPARPALFHAHRRRRTRARTRAAMAHGHLNIDSFDAEVQNEDEVLYMAPGPDIGRLEKTAKRRRFLTTCASIVFASSAVYTVSAWWGSRNSSHHKAGVRLMKPSRFFARTEESMPMNGSAFGAEPVYELSPLPNNFSLTCASLVCPEGYSQRPGLESRPCQKTVAGECTKADVKACCWPVEPLCRAGRVLDFGASSVLHNNLDGEGPGRGEPGLTLFNAMSHEDCQNCSAAEKRITNLEMFSIGNYAADPQFIDRNGLDKDRRLARVSVRPGTSLDLIGRFVEHPSWGAVTLEPFYISVLDMQGGSLGVGGFDSYSVSRGSKVSVEVGADGLVWFTAPARVASEPFEEPMDPLLLTAAQLQRSVALRMPGGGGFSMSLRVNAAARPEDGRLLLTGSTSLTCPPPLTYIGSVVYRDRADGGNRSAMGDPAVAAAVGLAPSASAAQPVAPHIA